LASDGSRVAVVEVEQCPTLRSVGARSYLGYRLLGDGSVEHLVEDSEGRLVRVKADCGSCVFCRLIRSTYLVGPPVVKGEAMKFTVVYNRAARRILESERGRVRSLRILRREAVLLTEAQREALALSVDRGPRVSELARSLGVSKPAASKALRKALRKAYIILA
jgi:predicted DNA binding protein